MIVLKVFRRFELYTKFFIWRLFPTLAIYYYRRKRLKHDVIVLLIHQGLGDLSAMASAIKVASSQHSIVYVVTKKEFFDTIGLLFEFSENIRNINSVEGKTKRFKVSPNFIKDLKKLGHLIKFGLFDNDPKFEYPNSFYIKFGFNPRIATKKFNFDHTKYFTLELEKFLKSVKKEFIFYSNETTDGFLQSHYIDKFDKTYDIITCFSNFQKESSRVHDISELNRYNFVRQVLNSIYICALSKHIIISDAGFFNILIRLVHNIDIRVIWRKHPLSLNKEIYGVYLK